MLVRRTKKLPKFIPKYCTSCRSEMLLIDDRVFVQGNTQQRQKTYSCSNRCKDHIDTKFLPPAV